MPFPHINFNDYFPRDNTLIYCSSVQAAPNRDFQGPDFFAVLNVELSTAAVALGTKK